MAKFLTPEWFKMIAALTDAAQGLEIPKAMKDVVVNLTIAGPDGPIEMRMDRGILRLGHAATADVLMQMPADADPGCPAPRDRAADRAGMNSHEEL